MNTEYLATMQPSGRSIQTRPLTQIAFQGLHLIEASAGTGKTFTLANLIVRILIEAYLPRQVIATTFTRAAAAELKSRIRDRLQTILGKAQQWELNPPNLTHMAQEVDELEQLLLTQFSSSADSPTSNFAYLVNRLQFVLDSLDELFVGTIDSFVQKILREFAFDAGQLQHLNITENEHYYPYQIAHDVLRAWIQDQPQLVIDTLVINGTLKPADDYVNWLKESLNFSDTAVQPVEKPTLDCIQPIKWLQAIADQMRQPQLQIIAPYFDSNNAHYNALFDGRMLSITRRHEIFHVVLPALIDEISTLEQQPVHYFSKHVQGLLQQLFRLFLKGNHQPYETVFKKNVTKHDQVTFLNHPLIQTIKELMQAHQNLQIKIKQFDQYLHYHIMTEVRQRLPQVLQYANETTFNQQSRILAQALQGAGHEALAKAVIHRYPMLVVDEFQDTNQTQDLILAKIWRCPSHMQEGCLIMVGDPKQAIYGFRGGDVLTYNNAKQDIASKGGHLYRLADNYRSVPDLVEAVDALFSTQTDFGEGIVYFNAHVDRAKSPKANQALVENDSKNPNPLRLIGLNEDQKKNEAWIIAQTIAQLLDQSARGLTYFEEHDHKKSIRPADIAVLASSNRQLDHIQQTLEQLGLPVNRALNISVFETAAAQEIAALLQAMIEPDDERIVKRALISPLMGYGNDVFDSASNDQQVSTHMLNFRLCREVWQQHGFLAAWQRLTLQYQVWRSIAQRCGQESERMLIDCRHLIDILSQYSQHMGMQHLLHWYQLQLGAPLQREWEMQRPLSHAEGIELMTIHKSKGLEFKIVFLMYANQVKTGNDTQLAHFLVQPEPDGPTQRALAINPQQLNDQQRHHHQQRIDGENHRLWYVAVTRASYRVYAYFYPIAQSSSPDQHQANGLDYWRLSSPQAEQKFQLMPVALAPTIERWSAEPPLETDQTSVKSMHAHPLPFKRLYPHGQTSFSALTASERPTQDLVAAQTEPFAVMDEQDSPTRPQVSWIDRDRPQNVPIARICAIFPKGIQGGNCLHALLEVLPFRQSKFWADDIQRVLTAHQIDDGQFLSLQQNAGIAPTLSENTTVLLDEHPQIQLISDMQHWLQAIIHYPLTDQDQNFSLSQIESTHRQSELSFSMSLAERYFDIKHISHLFERHQILLPDLYASGSTRFLNGAIDLVFYQAGRYHIADYKSNYLGDQLMDYHQDHLKQSMQHAGYFLQAAIYLVALHRYLRVHLAGYDIHQHLGAAHYLYLRGMHPYQTDCGVYTWHAPIELITELDQILG